jgi:hypothetical protein
LSTISSLTSSPPLRKRAPPPVFSKRIDKVSQNATPSLYTCRLVV